MKKIHTTAFLTAGLLLLSGCASKDSSSSESSPETTTTAPAEYKSGTFTTYQLPNFSFTISDDFETLFYDYSDGKVRNEVFFGNELFDRLRITGYGSLYDDIAYYGESLFDAMKWMGTPDVSYELIDLDGFQAAVIDYTEKWEGEDKFCSNYTAICEGKEFNIFAMCPVENKDKAVPMLNDIIRSAVYTSDYRLPTGQQEFENDLYSISFGPEWIMEQQSRDGGTKKTGTLCSDYFRFAQATSYAEHGCFIDIEVDAAEENSAVKEADRLQEEHLSSKFFKYDSKRSQTELLGQTAETVLFCWESNGEKIKTDYYLFEHGGNLFRISIVYCDDDQQEEILRKFNELIGNITLK